MVRVGVLALQGAVREHQEVLEGLGVEAPAVRTTGQLATVDGLVVPGGESTAMVRLGRTNGLIDALQARVRAGMPVLGTCAGLILLADRLADRAGLEGFELVGGLDITVRRNAYGAQLHSGRQPVVLTDGRTVPGVFIRAPRIEQMAPGVELLGAVGDEPVAVRQGHLLGCSFHPELSGDDWLHRLLVEQLAQ